LTPLEKPLLSIPVPKIKEPSTNFLTSQKLVKSSAHRHYLISFSFILISNSFLQCAPLHLTYIPLQTAFSSAIIGVGQLQ
ncbi:MAG: hypothetical protein K2H90_03515, partial [Oscillospiraceae bacterium]|nr:hypothetical protein [Oscillospiraceae bacterium]